MIQWTVLLVTIEVDPVSRPDQRDNQTGSHYKEYENNTVDMTL